MAGTQLCFGDAGQARALLQKARALDEGGSVTSAGSLNGMAYELAGLGQLDGATQLLRIVAELHPKEANLYDSLGELELRAGRREASIAAYRKALGIDRSSRARSRRSRRSSRRRAKENLKPVDRLARPGGRMPM